MKSVVIGASGYVGRHLVRALRAAGQDVLELSSADGSGIDPKSGLFSLAPPIPPGTSAVFFLAQSPRYRQVPQEAPHLLAVNTVAAVQAAEASARAGVKTFVYASTGNVYQSSFLPLVEDQSPVRRDGWYALSKVMAEDALRLFSSQMNVCIARIFGVFGPGQEGKLVPMLADSIRSGRTITLDGRCDGIPDDDGLRISLMYVDDLVEALCKLAEKGCSGVFNVAGSRAISIREIAHTLGKVLARPIRLDKGENCRPGDLIADIGRLRSWVTLPDRDIGEMLARVCSESAGKS